MAIRAAFIGINKYSDPKIRELTGARRDATALWALFSDSLSDMDGQLIVDAEATLDRIRQALEHTLLSAEPEDVIILTFSGHGTHDHRLVAHNTAVDALATTTLSMEDLARYFRESKSQICNLHPGLLFQRRRSRKGA
jgi:helicase